MPLHFLRSVALYWPFLSNWGLYGGGASCNYKYTSKKPYKVENKDVRAKCKTDLS